MNFNIQNQEVKVLFVLSRRGLYQYTYCKNCGHAFKSPESDSYLVTYRTSPDKLELVDSHTQNVYTYPNECPVCGQKDIESKFGGIDDLQEKIETFLGVTPKRLDNAKQMQNQVEVIVSQYKPFKGEIYLTTRLFDPSIDYSSFDKIIVLQAQSIGSGIDYLSEEEGYRSVRQLLLAVNTKSEVIFDSSDLDTPVLKDTLLLINQQKSLDDIYTNFAEIELHNRQKFGFPPYTNLLLVTCQLPKKDVAWQTIIAAYRDLQNELSLRDISLSYPYPAKILKRKNMFSYHILLKFPRQYKDFDTLRKRVIMITSNYNLQTRLNPRHIF